MVDEEFLEWLSNRLETKDRGLKDTLPRYISITEEMVEEIIEELEERGGDIEEVAREWYMKGEGIFVSKRDAEDFYDTYEGEIWETFYLVGRDRGYYDAVDYLADRLEVLKEVEGGKWFPIRGHKDMKRALALLVCMDVAGYYWEYMRKKRKR